MANMVGAFFGRGTDGNKLFDALAIAQDEAYSAHLNQHNVIYIDLSIEPEKCTSYDRYITRILDGIKADLFEGYPELAADRGGALWDILTGIFQKTGEKFIFVIDEWDAVFHLPYMSEEDKPSYLRFLRSLLKGQAYVELVYMTGVLPIEKYSSGSELNMFLEYDMATKRRFSDHFGFLDHEVDDLYAIYRETSLDRRITREDLRIWYDGYHTAKGVRLYDPRSVVCALTDDELASYWTSSGPYDEIFYYIKNNVEEIRDDLALMVSGVGIETKMQEYAASASELETKDQIYSAMVVYGLLTYEQFGEMSSGK